MLRVLVPCSAKDLDGNPGTVTICRVGRDSIYSSMGSRYFNIVVNSILGRRPGRLAIELKKNCIGPKLRRYAPTLAPQGSQSHLLMGDRITILPIENRVLTISIVESVSKTAVWKPSLEIHES